MILQKIKDWWDNIPSFESHMAIETCDKIIALTDNEHERRRVFAELMSQWVVEEPKLARQFLKHQDHLFRKKESWRSEFQ